MKVPVVIHRWFKDGEGWGYHPSLSGDAMRSLIRALGRRLEERKEGSFREEIPELRQVAVGEVVSDPEPLDPKAQGRQPVILRAALLPAGLRAQPPDVWQLQLSRVEASAEGPSADLEVDLPLRRGSRWLWVLALLVLSTLLFAGCYGWFLESPFGFRRQVGNGEKSSAPNGTNKKTDEQNDKRMAEIKRMAEAVARLEASLRRWALADPALKDAADAMRQKDIAMRQKAIARSYFHLLSQDRQELKGKLDGKHPDVQFVQRLPEKPYGQALDDKLSFKNLTDELASLANHLKAETGNGNQKGDNPAVSLIQGIDQALDPDAWLDEERPHFVFANIGRRDEAVAQFVARFVSSPANTDDRTEFQRAAEKMVVLLVNDWKTEGVTKKDAENRPRFVFHCFFDFLSQRAFDPKKDLKSNHFRVGFVKRLPEDPWTTPRPVRTLSDLKRALRDLATKLDGREPKTDSVIQLVKTVGESMDYKKWKEKVDSEKSEFTDDDPLTDPVKEFVRRFERKD